MKALKARHLAAQAYATSDTDLAGAALSLLKHRHRRDRVAEGLAALVKGGGVPANAIRNDQGQPILNDSGGYVLKEAA